MVSDLRTVMTLDEIAQAIGMHSRGAIHGIATGRQKNVTYEVGVKLAALHKRKAKQIASTREAKA